MCYWWRKHSTVERTGRGTENELRDTRHEVQRLTKERDRWKGEAENIAKTREGWKTEAEAIRKERDAARDKARLHELEASFFREERDRVVAQAAEEKRRWNQRKSTSEKPSPSKETAEKDRTPATDDFTVALMCREIDERVKELRELPQEKWATELRTLKRSYHPDAQKVKSATMQRFFTQLSQHINGFCEAHLKRDCSECK